MPFAIRFDDDGTYLKAQRHSTLKRARVQSVEGATQWSAVGHAKNAIHLAIEQHFIKKNESVVIVEVAVTVVRVVDRVRWHHSRSGPDHVVSEPAKASP